MKQKIIGLSQRYMMALRKHLKPGRRAGLPPAERLERRTVVPLPEPLELARIYERAFAALDLFQGKMLRQNSRRPRVLGRNSGNIPGALEKFKPRVLATLLRPGTGALRPRPCPNQGDFLHRLLPPFTSKLS